MKYPATFFFQVFLVSDVLICFSILQTIVKEVGMEDIE